LVNSKPEADYSRAKDIKNKPEVIFTALHGMQTRSSDKNSVRLSVCLSVRLSHACIVTKR